MSGRLSIRVAILKASWASLKMWDDEWMFFWIDSSTVSSLRLSPKQENDRRGALEYRRATPCCFFLSTPRVHCERSRTFGSGEHGRGQLTLLRLYVAQGEPAWITVGHHGHDVVRPWQVTRGGRRLQHRQPGEDSMQKKKERTSDPSHVTLQLPVYIICMILYVFCTLIRSCCPKRLR